MTLDHFSPHLAASFLGRKETTLRFSIPDARATGYVLTRNKMKKLQQMLELFHFVAGSGIEPESGGYEPPEVPLL